MLGSLVSDTLKYVLYHAINAPPKDSAAICMNMVVCLVVPELRSRRRERLIKRRMIIKLPIHPSVTKSFTNTAVAIDNVYEKYPTIIFASED